MKSIKSSWFNGVCEECKEKRSVRKGYFRDSIGFYCWVCVPATRWFRLHMEKPFTILNIREWTK